MEKEKYLRHQMQILAIGQAVNALDLDNFIASIDSAEASMVEIDPSIYSAARKNLAAIKHMAAALKPAKEAFIIVHEAIQATRPPEPPHAN